MVEGLTAAQGAEAPRKPALLKGGMLVAWINAAVLALLLLITPSIGQVGLVTGTLSTQLSPSPETQSTFTTDILTASRIFLIPLLALSIVVAYGLAKDRHWSRWVMMLLLVAAVVLIPAPLANAINYGLSIALAIFGWWYLYRKPNVVEYYRLIKTKSN
jgi:hypothetical protein